MSKVRVRRTGGFTLVELMIVVAILSVIAVLAVVSYGRYIRKAVRSEVIGMLGEMRAKEEAYQVENGSYLSTNTANDESLVYPALLGATELRVKPWAGAPAQWTQLGVNPPRQQLYCGYVAIAGPANDWTNAGVAGKALLGTVPRVPWYYARACCDLDQPRGGATCPAGNTTLSVFQIAFSTNTLVELNEGQ
jgi:prepilin-type N-terminal cleavage/methylation domain-containing protein